MVSTALLSCKMVTTSPPPMYAPKITHNLVPKTKFYCSKLSYDISKRTQYKKPSFNYNGSMSTARVPLACSASEPGRPEEHGSLETVLKLYEAIKNKNIYELSDIIAEECSCVSNIVSTFQPFLGKKQVLAFFSSLMKNLGNNIEFVVQHTLDDGMVVSVSWKLECNKVHLPLGKGFSVYMCHVYQGKVMIKNVEIFLEPLIHLEPLRLKVIPLLVTAMEKFNPKAIFRDKKIKAIVVFAILFSLVSMFKYWTWAKSNR